MKVTISKTFKADLAHIVETQDIGKFLKNIRAVINKCRFIHGHTVKIQVFIRGLIDKETAMIIDFNALKPFKEFIDTFLDHKLILPKNTQFPYVELIELFNDFYENKFKSSVYMEKPTVTFPYDGEEILATSISTVTVLEVPATTAEYMSLYLAKVLAYVLETHTTIDKETEIKVRFYETESSYAETDFYTIDFWSKFQLA